ncbi:hypothetical protein HDU76_003960 [Blyttiomyces sp. JEL0837]|nr:hypothetical protein HDU76_003960 [Blyttiomyces sp. JEL0837]
MTDNTSSTVSIDGVAQRARAASHRMQSVTSAQKSATLKAIHAALKSNQTSVLAANKLDLDAAKAEVAKGGLSGSLVKRLDLGSGGDKYASLLQGVLDVDKLADPTGQITLATRLDEGLDLYRVTCPIGVLLIIFEARPEVVVQISCLAIKSGNAVILKGGKEATHSNQILYQTIRKAILDLPEGSGIPADDVQLDETRHEIDRLLAMDRDIDLVIPRGSNQLVRHIQGNTRIPVLGHADGLCSVYLDATADQEKAIPIVIDAKTSYPAACNSTETLLINTSLYKTQLPKHLFETLIQNKVRLYLDAQSLSHLRQLVSESIQSSHAEFINETDSQSFDTEFLDLSIAVKSVGSLDEAIDHINAHGSHHTDAIVTEDAKAAESCFRRVDAAGVYWNASTRFADGFRYGFGAEIGVSTNKTHARGPVGLEGLVIYKYRLYGKGQASANYGDGAGKKQYLHEPIAVTAELATRFRQ